MSKMRYDTEMEKLEGGVVSYLQDLCDKDYESCDMHTTSDGFKIMGFGGTLQALKSPLSQKVYYQFMDYVIDSIQSVKILSIKQNVNTGYTEYEVEICYIPYEQANELSIDQDRLTSLMDGFVNEEINEEDFSKEIETYCFELFRSNFKLKDSNYISTKVLTLSEKRSNNGVAYVYGTDDFIKGLIPDEMYEILDLYQRDIKAKVGTVLRQY